MLTSSNLEKMLLRLIEQMNGHVNPPRDAKLKAKATKFVELVPRKEEMEGELIGYKEFVQKHFAL